MTNSASSAALRVHDSRVCSIRRATSTSAARTRLHRTWRLQAHGSPCTRRAEKFQFMAWASLSRCQCAAADCPRDVRVYAGRFERARTHTPRPSACLGYSALARTTWLRAPAAEFDRIKTFTQFCKINVSSTIYVASNINTFRVLISEISVRVHSSATCAFGQNGYGKTGNDPSFMEFGCR